MKPKPRTAWLAGIRAQIEPVGGCMEWQGCYFGATPVVYSPAGYLWPGSVPGKHSLRSVLYGLATGARLPAGRIIRMRCWNERCVHEDHFGILSRGEQAAEQSRRGELQTHKARAAKVISSRRRAKLTDAQVDAIRTSGEPSKVEAERHGVSRQTINAIRRSKMRAQTLPLASVFSLGALA